MSYTITAAAVYAATIYQLFLRGGKRPNLERAEILAAREATNYSVSNTTIFPAITSKSHHLNPHYRAVPITYWSWLLLVQGVFVLAAFANRWQYLGYSSLVVWLFYAYAVEQCDKQGRLRGVQLESVFGPVATFAGSDRFHWYAVASGASCEMRMVSDSDSSDGDEDEDEDEDDRVHQMSMVAGMPLMPGMPDVGEFGWESVGEEVVFDDDHEPSDEDGYGEDEVLHFGGDDDDSDSGEPKFVGFSPILSPHDSADCETKMLDQWDRESYAPDLGFEREQEREDELAARALGDHPPGSIQLVLRQVGLPMPADHHFQGFIGVYRHTKLNRSTVVHTCIDPMDYEAMEQFVI